MVADNKDLTARIWCGLDDPPQDKKSRYSRRLNSIPPKENVYLKVSNISNKLVQNLSAVALDLLEIATYIYCADQSKTRGGNTFPLDGRNWYRKFELSIPVRCPEIWNNPQVSEKLIELLRFMANDDYQFVFRKLKADFPREAYFEFDEGEPWFKPDSILLFSGGLDSLTGAVEELRDVNRKILLVSHRSVSKIDKPQRDLVAELKNRYNANNRLFHIPVWINKEKGITKDANQRSRSFLYASIAAVIASMTGSREIKFYENGIISSNLPISKQAIEARASRSTHPKTLRLMSELFSAMFQHEFKVINPFFNKTKSDVLKALKINEGQELISISRSCTRTMSSTKLHTHCGTCSQCIERRLAVLNNELEEFDPEEMYQIRLFQDKLDSKNGRLMTESYIRHVRALEEIDIDTFFECFPDGFILARELNLPVNEAAQLLYDLHNRHGCQTAEVINSQIRKQADRIRTGQIPQSSLLGMILGKSGLKKQNKNPTKFFPTPEGTQWKDVNIELVSNDSIRVKVGNIIKRFSGFNIGFTDERKGDLLDHQWELLMLFAEKNGEISTKTIGYKPNLQKPIQTLNRRLRILFGIMSNPIKRYSSKSGWTTKFKISDKSAGKP